MAECPKCNGTGNIELFDGAAFRRWRRANDLPLRVAAYDAAISVPYLSELERGTKQPAPVLGELLTLMMQE